MGNHQELLDNYPDGTYALFVAKQANAEQKVDPTAVATETAQRKLEEELKIDGAKNSGSPGKKGEDPMHLAKLEEANKNDEEELKRIEKLLAPLKEKSDFMKILKFNSPLILVGIACIGAAAAGISQPLLGVVFAKVMNILTVPLEVWPKMGKPENYLETETIYWVWWCIGVATMCFIGLSIRGICFGYLGENVTFQVR